VSYDNILSLSFGLNIFENKDNSDVSFFREKQYFTSQRVNLNSECQYETHSYYRQLQCQSFPGAMHKVCHQGFTFSEC
jgi:hypothetical protein